MTVKLSHERKVRSFAKNTFGSTRTGRAIFLEGVVWRRGCVDIVGRRVVGVVTLFEFRGGEEGYVGSRGGERMQQLELMNRG